MKIVDVYDLPVSYLDLVKQAKDSEDGRDDADPANNDQAGEESTYSATKDRSDHVVAEESEGSAAGTSEAIHNVGSEPNSPVESESNRRTVMLLVKPTDEQDNTGRVHALPLPLDLEEAQILEIQWYLEEFVTTSPYENVRAEAALASLRNHAKSVIEKINWHDLLGGSPSGTRLVIRIQLEDKSRGHHVFWELFENRELWPAEAPDDVQVLRMPFSDLDALPSMYALKHREVFNILVVSARPKAEADIPHRRVSRIIIEVVSNLPAEAKAYATVELVRPGTFEALQEHIKGREGYFNLVHFDLHGSEDDSNAYLDFLAVADSKEPTHVSRNPVSATDLASFLASNGVTYVVMNACRSARGSGIHSNIALTMLENGIRACVAMAYNIVSRSAEIFTRTFYEALLIHDASFDVAAKIGRQALAYVPQRRSKFGQLVEIDDSMVPIVYLHGRAHWTPRYPTTTIEITDPEVTSEPFPYGRENDILKIETALLVTKRPLMLTGIAGVGKTCLVKHLAAWWVRSRLITSFKHIQLSQPEGEMELERLVNASQSDDLVSEIPPANNTNILQPSKALLIIDGLELVGRSTGASARRRRDGVKRLLTRLTELVNDSCLIIVTSRCREQWLSAIVHPCELKGLGTIAGIEILRFYVKQFQSLAIIADYDGPEDGQFFEQIVKLVDGNPLALHAISNDFLCSGMTPKEYYISILNGAPFLVNRPHMEKNEGWRSMVEIDRLIDESNPQTFSDAFGSTILAQFWQFFPEMDMLVFVLLFSSQSAKRLGMDAQSRMSGLEAWVAQIRELVPQPDHEFDSYMDLLRSMSQNQLSETEGTPLNLVTFALLLEDIRLEDMVAQMPNLQTVTRAIDRIVKPLKATGFLESYEPQYLALDLQSKDYLRVHPLLPLMLRAEPVYHQNFFDFREIVKEGFALYYIYRAKSFPTDYMYYNPIWEIPRQQLSLEFANFASAALISLKQTDSEPLREIAMFKMLMTIHRGVLVDTGRFRVVVPIWELAVEYFKDAEARVMSKTSSNTTLQMLSSMLPKFWSGFQKKPKDETGDGWHLSEEVALFNTRYFLLSMLSPLVLHYHHNRSTKQEYYVKIAESCYKRLKSAEVPNIVSEDKNYFNRVLDFTMYNIRVSADLNVPSPSEMWEQRQQLHKMVAEHNGVETVPQEQSGWQDLPVGILAASALVSKFTLAARAIRDAIDQHQFEFARKLIDNTLLQEINEAGNDEMNKATLLKYRSEIDEEQGRWREALQHFLEAEDCERRTSLQHGRPLNLGFKRTFWQEMKRRKLARKAKEEEQSAAIGFGKDNARV